MTRAISERFCADLQGGKLKPILDKVRNDDTLMLALRGSYINIYYRGGSILRLGEMKDPSYYIAEFDWNYAKGSSEIRTAMPPSVIGTSADANCWAECFKDLKEIMNAFFVHNSKAEREFQQLVAWENNRSAIANQTEYFITDIEFADSGIGARLDMIGVKWVVSDRQRGSRCQPVFIEMKYGDDALHGPAGIIKHIDDLRTVVTDPSRCAALKDMVQQQFDQLSDFGLLRYNRSDSLGSFTIGEPEVVFLFSNHNPRSRTLLDVLEKIEEPLGFDLRFFVASSAGYGLHESCMFDLESYRQMIRLFWGGRPMPLPFVERRGDRATPRRLLMTEANASADFELI